VPAELPASEAEELLANEIDAPPTDETAEADEGDEADETDNATEEAATTDG
jgi:hypothetical protein